MALTHHKLLPGNPAVIESEKPIIFLMDDIKEDPEEEPPKKKKKGKKSKDHKGNQKGKDVTFKNFGAGVSVNIFKQGSKLAIGWRCRCQSPLVL